MAGEAFDPDAFLAEGDESFDPDAFLAEEEAPPEQPAPGPIAPSITGFTSDDIRAAAGDPSASFKLQTGLSDPFAGAARADRQRQTERAESLRMLFTLAQSGAEDSAAEELELSKKLGVSLDVVHGNLPTIKETAARVAFDPEAWQRENPELAKLVLERPEFAPVVLRNRKLSVVTRAFMKVSDLVPMSPVDSVTNIVDVGRALLGGSEGVQARAAAQEELDEKRAAGKQVEEIADQVALDAQGNPFKMARLRALETAAGMEVSRLGTELALARRRGADTTQIEAAIADAKARARPRFLDEGPVSQVLTDAVTGLTSSFGILGSGVEGAGMGAAAGGLAGAVATKTPAGAARGAQLGASLGARLKAGVDTMDVEFGSTYLELSEARTESGERISDDVAFGTALFAGALKTGIELAEFELQVKSVGPLASALKTGNLDALKGLLARDAGFRARMASLAKTWGPGIKAGLGEGLEEGSQTGVEQAATYAAKSIQQGELQQGPIFDTEAIKESVGTALPAGLVFAGAGPSMSLLAAKVTTSRSERAQAQVPALLAMADEKAVQVAAEPMAQLIADATEKGGDQVTSLHVDAHAIVRYFQDKGASPEEANQQVAQLVGPQAPAQLLEAAATGGKLEVPLDRALSTWGSSEIGKALIDDTTTAAELLTKRELKARGEEIEAKALELAKAEQAKLDEEGLLSQRTAELTQQLVDSGQTRQAAQAVAGVVRAFQATQAADFDQALSQVLPETPIAVAKGDEKEIGAEELAQEKDEATDSIGRILQGAREVEAQPGGRARAAYGDRLTGLLNKKGFDLVQKPDAPGVVVALTSTDVKPINDKVNHVQTDRFFKALGRLVADVDPRAARAGTNFLFRAESLEKARELVETWRGQFPAGLRMTVGAGTSSTQALADLEDRVDTGRAKGRLSAQEAAEFFDEELLAEFPDEAELPSSRLGTDLDLEALKKNEAAFGPELAPLDQEIPAEVAAAAEAEFRSTEEFADKQNFDDLSDGLVLNGRGFAAVGEKRWVMSLDGIGLKTLNETYSKLGSEKFGMSRHDAKAFGKAMGDKMLKLISQVAHDMGGMGVAFARLSGDEYAAKHDDPAVLKAFAADLFAELEDAAVDVDLPDGSTTTVKAGLRWGIGRRTYEAADVDLTKRKASGRAGAGSLPRQGVPDQRPGRAFDRGILEEARGRSALGPREVSPGAGSQEGQVTRLKQGEGVPKGYTSVPAGRALQSTVRVFLNKSADVSTALHEAAHAFLEHLGDLVERADAPQRTKDTYAAALKALGVEKRSELGREHHEKFARAFEQYALEGKAPSSALRKAFNLFQRWLMQVYRAVRGVPGAELSAELTPVFDAMLATEGQLEALRKQQGPVLTAEQLRLQKAERQAQLDQELEWYTEGSHTAQLAAVKDALRVREAWWKKGLEQLERTFADEYEQLPARRAQQLLIEQELVLDRAAVQEVIGDARVPGLRTKEGGVRPSAVAELVGFDSPRAMLAALAGLRPKDTWVKAQAEATMRAQHPSILDDVKKFRGLLSDGLRSATERRLMRELGGLDAEATKRAAEMLVAQRPVGKLQPGRALAQQRAAANAKARAMAKGDIAATRAAGQVELLNHYLHGQLRDAQAEIERFEALATRLGKTSARERLGKASPAYRDAVDFLRGALGLGPATELDATTLQAAVAQLEGDAVTIGDPDWLAPLQQALAKDDYRKLTVAELEAVSDALKMINAGATKRTTVLVDGKQLDFDTAKAEVLKDLQSTTPARGAIVAKNDQTRLEKLKSGINWLDGFLLSPVDMFRELTGDNQNSMLWKVFVNPMRRATSLEADLLKERFEPILKAFDEMPDDVRAKLGDQLDPALFPSHIPELARPRYRDSLLALALNAGSESSRRVLLEGRGISEEQLLNALNQLSKEEIAWVNAVHESLEQLRDPMFDLEERATGLRPQAVKSKPTKLQNGVLKGGYFPLKADPDASNTGAKQFGDDQLAALTDPSFTRPGTAHGHLKNRTGAAYPVSLDLDVIRRHLRQATHDLAFREAVQGAGRMFMDPEVQAELKNRLGVDKTREILTWLKDIGGARGIDDNAMLALFRFLKGNAATALLSGASTAIGNLANLAAAPTSTKLKTKHLAAGMGELARSPRAARADAMAKSGILRAMDNELLAGVEKELASVRAGKASRALQAIREAGMWMMRTVDGVVSTAVWIGAHRQALADGKDAAAAVRWADDLLLQVQPSSSAVEKAGILRNKGAIGAMTMFYGYLSVAYRANHRIASPLFTQEFQSASAPKRALMAGKVAGQMLGFWLAFGALGEFLMGRGPEDGDRDDEDPENKALQWRNWVTRKLLVAPLTLIPVVPVASGTESLLLKKRTMARTDPMSQLVVTMFETIGAAVEASKDEADDDAGEKAAHKALRTLFLATGLPIRPLETTAKYLVELFTGERIPENAADAASGIVYGERENQPTTPLTGLGDLLFE